IYERRDVAVVDDDDAVDLFLRVQLGEPVRDRLRVVVRRLVDEALPVSRDLVAAEAQARAALATDDGPHELVFLAALLPLQLEGAAQHLAVERPGEPAVAGEDHDTHTLHFAPLHEREVAEG